MIQDDRSSLFTFSLRMLSSDRFEKTKWEELKCFVSGKESGEQRPWRGKSSLNGQCGWWWGGGGVREKETKWLVASVELSDKNLEVCQRLLSSK